MSKVGLPLMSHTAVHNLLSELTSSRLLNSISSQLCRQNTQFMHTTTSKQQESTTCKDSCPKYFIATNFDKFHREGAIDIDLKIENLDRVSMPAKSVATFEIRHPIHGTTYGVRRRSAFEAVFVHFSLCWAI